MPGITLNYVRESPNRPAVRTKLECASKEPYKLKLLVCNGVKKSLLPTTITKPINASAPEPNSKIEVPNGGLFFAKRVPIYSN